MTKSVRMPGSIREVSPGKWVIVVGLGYDESGKYRQKKKVVTGNQTEAKAVLTELLHQRNMGVDLRPTRFTVQQYLEGWLKDHGRNLKASTLKTYRDTLRKHIFPHLGKIQLKDLKPFQIRKVEQHIEDTGGSSKTALNTHRILREALQHALQEELILRNPADQVKAPRAPKFEPIVLNHEQIDSVLAEATKLGVGTLFYVCVRTGFRQAELFDLLWPQVDLEQGQVRIKRRENNNSKRGAVKTDRSARLLSIGPDVVEVLRAHRAEQLEYRLRLGGIYKDEGRVFPNTTGGRLNQTYFWTVWKKVMANAGVPEARFHDLRHANATILLSMGVPLKIVSERLGHSSIVITADIYQHVLPHLDAEAAAKVDDFFRRESAQ